MLRLLIALTIPLAAAQTPSFEVASIRVNASGSTNSSINPKPGGRYSATNVTVFQLVRSSFGVQDFQIADAPDWFYSLRYDIEAKAVDEATTPDRLQAMVQTLLKERFRLSYRRETREGRVLALVVTKNSHKLKPVSGECVPAPAGGSCGSFRASNGRIEGPQVTMTQFAARLTRSLGQNVVDKSGLAGTFDLTLEWTPETDEQGDAPTVYTAIQEQLGLRLESSRGPVDTFVVEHVEKPTDN
jgi:uncharacterized protein (TIGR03435 family)